MVAVMEGHYTSAIAAHDALIRGDLATLRARLGELATQALPTGAPQTWRPLHARLQSAARESARATTLEAAGPAMGGVVEACGACHQTLGTGPIYRRPLPSEGTTQVEQAMLGHQWATERLWEGITGPREEAWHRGAAAIAARRVFAEGAGTTPALLAREAALRSAGQSAMSTAGLHERAMAYGQLLSTCADCHREALVPLGGAAEPE